MTTKKTVQAPGVGLKGLQNQKEDTAESSSCDSSSIMISGSGLMERTNVESKRSKLTSHWGGTRDPGIVDIGQTEYIARLTALRDSLIDQEQLYLAQALDRLRIHSLTNKNSSYRLRMNGDDLKKSPPASQRRNMVTTVQKFRQMRPKREHQVILPLQGKQLFDRNTQGRPSSEEPGSSAGNVSNRSAESRVGETSRTVPSKIDDTIQSNLQRLIQPTSSIPNIGRKALRHQEHLELKPKPIDRSIRSRIHKQTGRQLASPYIPIQEVTAANFPMSPYPLPMMNHHQLHYQGPAIGSVVVSGLSPGSQKRAGHSQNDTVDMDRTEACCYEDYIDTSRPQTHEMSRGAVEGGGGSRGQSGNGPRRTPQSSSSKRRSHKRPPASFHQTRFRRHHNPKSSTSDDYLEDQGHVVKNLSNGFHNGNGNSHDYRNSNGGSEYYYMSDPSFSASIMNGSFYSTGEESDAEIPDTSRTRLPAIRQGEGEMHTTARSRLYRSHQGQRRSSHDLKNSRGESVVRPTPVVVIHNGNALYRDASSCSESDFGNPAENSEHTPYKKHIVVDMPAIVFNAPSPAPPVSDEENGNISQGQTSSPGQGHDPQTTLKKTLKQQEIRRRELSNLLEDVKELNMRSEALSSQSMNDPE